MIIVPVLLLISGLVQSPRKRPRETHRLHHLEHAFTRTLELYLGVIHLIGGLA